MKSWCWTPEVFFIWSLQASQQGAGEYTKCSNPTSNGWLYGVIIYIYYTLIICREREAETTTMKKERNPCWLPKKEKEREREIYSRQNCWSKFTKNGLSNECPKPKAGFLPNSFCPADCPADWLYPVKWSWLFHFPSPCLSRRLTHESQTLAISATEGSTWWFDSKLRNKSFRNWNFLKHQRKSV